MYQYRGGKENDTHEAAGFREGFMEGSHFTRWDFVLIVHLDIGSNKCRLGTIIIRDRRGRRIVYSRFNKCVMNGRSKEFGVMHYNLILTDKHVLIVAHIERRCK